MSALLQPPLLTTRQVATRPSLATLFARAHLGLGVAGLIALLAAALCFFQAADDWGRSFAQLSAGLPPIHVPAAITSAGNIWLARLFYLLLGVALVATSAGLISSRQRRDLLLATAALALAEATLCTPERRPFMVFPSALERNLAAGNMHLAEQILNQVDVDTAAKNYVAAQIALHTGDQLTLNRLAPELLQQVDALVYRLNEDAMPSLLHSLGDARVEVIHALDQRVNAAVLSSVAIDFQQRKFGGKPRSHWWAISNAAAALSLLIAALCAGRAWARHTRTDS